MKLKTLDSIEMDISIENLYIGRIAMPWMKEGFYNLGTCFRYFMHFSDIIWGCYYYYNE